MSSNARFSPEPGKREANLEERIRRAAAVFPYPETPAIAERERRRVVDGRRGAAGRKPNRLTTGLALLVILLLASLLVTPVRARVLDWIRIGAVRIFFVQPTATIAAPSAAPSPQVTPTTLQSVLDLSGETSLADAQEKAGFIVQLPTYPSELGLPDHVYFQQFNLPVVMLVWMNEDNPEQVRMTLSQSSAAQVIFEKYEPKNLIDTQVSGQQAVWIEGMYVVQTRSGDVNMTRLVNQGHTLIWRSGEFTFRMETDEDLDTALRIAESIR